MADEDAPFDVLGLKEYETEALRTLLTVGRTTAPNLADSTGIPRARIYGVLDSLVDRGFVEVVPGRPKKYYPKPPDEILGRAVESRRREYESYADEVEDIRDDFIQTYEPLYERASEEVTPTEKLFHVVDVGEPSENETRRLYDAAADEVRVLTKSFEYFDNVRRSFEDAVDRKVEVRVLFLHPRHLSDENAEIQSEIVEEIREYPVEFRFSDEKLPWRGTFVDPSMDYERGEAVLLVEEKDVPLRMRQAAVTENGSFVAGLSRYFDLIWEHESTESDSVEYPG